LAEQLEGAGYGVDRTGNEVDGVMTMNIAVEVHGSANDTEIVLVGAHYDSAHGCPGADDNASGVAGVLALARRFKSATPDRTLRFVFFSNEEPPYFKTPNMGSLVYAKAASGRGDRVVAMLSLDSIGYFSDAQNSQQYPKPLADKLPATGNFVAVLGNTFSETLVGRVFEALRARATVPAEGGAFAEDLPGVGWSDHWSFWQVRAPAVMITDTAPFRNPNYHKPDTPDSLDYARMARVVAGVESVIAELVGDVMAPSPNRQTPHKPLF
jgi:Zn-dependent M28 family amino/carboxypeptidase